MTDPTMPRPGVICGQLLEAMGTSEGRRKRRARNTTPDAIGMQIKRDLLRRAAEDDPPTDAFEDWLLEQCLVADASGPVRAMAMEILAEWRVAMVSQGFRGWLEEGAPSDDRGGDRPGPLPHPAAIEG